MAADGEGCDWTPGEKVIADLAALDEQVDAIDELAVSPDGEHVVAVARKEEDVFGFAVDGGDLGEAQFERAWKLGFLEDGRWLALVRADDEWTVAVDGEPWEERFDFAWNVRVSADQRVIAAQVKQGMDYTIAVDGKTWEQSFLACRDFAISSDGQKIAAAVQVEKLPEADIFKFVEGTWSVAVDGESWEQHYINVYGPAISGDGARVAAQIRTDIAEYTLAVDDVPWRSRFGCVWEPCFRPDGKLLVPVRVDGGWTLAEDGEPLWQRRYVQLWRQRIAPSGDRVAAVVAPSFGRWTIAVDDEPWAETFADLVLPPVIADDGRKVAAVFKDNGRWGVAVDGGSWPARFAMAWDPVFSSDGRVAAQVELDGKRTVALDGKLSSHSFDRLWQPRFSPDGKQLLLRGVRGTTVHRLVVACDRFNVRPSAAARA